MVYTCPNSLDGFMPHLSKADVKFRQQVGADLLAYLAEPENPVVCQDIGQFIDGLIPWMQNSNYKVSSNGIEVMTCLVDRLAHDFRPYLQTVLPVVVDRLGDAKDAVREKAQLLISKLLEKTVLSPQALLERLIPGFTHKNAKIREEVLRCFVNTLNEHGTHSVTISKFVPYIAALLSDQSATVRDTAFSTLVDLYKHVGEKLRKDLQKKNLVPPPKLPPLLARFDEVKDCGELLPTASISLELLPDEVDRAVMQKPAITAKKPVLGSATKRSAGPMRSAGSNSAGAVDEQTFIRSFDDVPTVQIYSSKETVEEMRNILQIISDPNKDWNKRVDALKKIRSLVIAGATNYEEFHVHLKLLDIPLQSSIKDLRSQVVREACISIAFLAQNLGLRFERLAELLLGTLINLIQNSAKVIATAGLLSVKFILQYIHSPRLIPIITSNATTSKSKDIRKVCCEFLDQILNQWPTHSLEKHITLLQESIKKGIADADPEARVSSRKAFRGFRDHFPEQAEALLQSLEPTYRRALQGELCLSSSSSSGSIAQTTGFKTSRPYKPAVTPQSATGSTENLCILQRAPSLPRSYRQRSGIPVLSRDNSAAKGRRSNSAIDLQAAQRAKARAQYAAMTRHKITSGTCSLPRPRKSIDSAATQSPERSRTRSRSSGVSQSQPTSRSGSPSSRLAYIYNRGGSAEHDSPRPRRTPSGIPRSTTGSRDASRETSPTRDQGTAGRFRAARTVSDRPPLSPASRPVMAAKILQASTEAEHAFADALKYDHSDYSIDHYRLNSSRKGMRSLDNHSDDSETSSVCSERSFESFRRASDSYSWSGSQQRLTSRDLWEPCRDINEIITLCASTVWQERKDGLVSLKYYINSGSELTPGELKHITEIFTKMFMDSHTKGLCIFIDTLNEIVKHYKADLHDWLYVLLQRIFLKLGTDLLSSTHGKLLNTLELIKKSFPLQLQIACVNRFLIDATQTPNTKVKITVLNFLTALCNIAEPDHLAVKPPAHQTLQKVIAYSQDPKSADLRAAAKNCLMAMWNCNTPYVTMALAELPRDQQEVASGVVRERMRRSSGGGEPGSPVGGGGSPKLMSSPKEEEAEREEIYRSLRKTTAEIQNYSYETLGSKLDRARDTTSQDSGISQMSLGNDKNGVNGITELGSNKYISSDEEGIVKAVLGNCRIDNPTPNAEKQRLLLQIKALIEAGQVTHIIPIFNKLLRILIDNLENKDMQMQLIVLQILTEVFKNKDLEQCWSHFVELLTLRVLSVYSDEKKDVVKAAEKTVAAMAVFPFSTVLNVLAPLLQTSQYPSLQATIKMVTKMVEVHPNEVTDDHLASIMPGLIKANDHEETSVRKSTVMCMVALHKAVGEERLLPYITSLPGSKLKLLRLYISRAQQQSPVPTSPKITAS